jgi:DNA-binding NarL/FixJ family response regulator
MRVLVVDDHELVRKGICSVLAAEPSLVVCGEAVDGQDAIEKATAERPDIVVMDISMPRLNGLEATREIKRLLPDVEIVIVSQHEAPEMVRQAFNAGACGYVVKSAISSDLIFAIANAHSREPFVKSAASSGVKQHPDVQEILQRSAAFEQALRESEERFRSAMNNMAEGLYTIDTQGRVTYINPSATAMFGWSSSEVMGKVMHDITHYKHLDGTPYQAADCPGLQVLEKGIELREHEDPLSAKTAASFQWFSAHRRCAKPARRWGSSFAFEMIPSGARPRRACGRTKESTGQSANRSTMESGSAMARDATFTPVRPF